MSDSLFAEAARLLDAHGWLPMMPANTSERHGRLSLRQALRTAAALESTAWLPAYVDWTVTTAAYTDAHLALEAILAEERGSQPTDPEWWQAQSGRTINEVLDLLERAALSAPSLARPAVAPRLRSGCTRKLGSSLQVAGVVAAASASAMRTTGASLGKTLVRAGKKDGLGNLSSEQLVMHLDGVASRVEIERDITLRIPPWRELPDVCLVFQSAAVRSSGLRPGRLLQTVAAENSLDLARVTDEDLAIALAGFKSAPDEPLAAD